MNMYISSPADVLYPLPKLPGKETFFTCQVFPSWHLKFSPLGSGRWRQGAHIFSSRFSGSLERCSCGGQKRVQASKSIPQDSSSGYHTQHAARRAVHWCLNFSRKPEFLVQNFAAVKLAKR